MDDDSIESLTTLPIISESFPEEAKLIADIFASWSALELFSTDLFALFTGMDVYQATVVLCSVESAKAKIDLILAAGSYTLRIDTHKRFLPRLTELCEALSGRSRMRHRYAHGVFASDQNGRLHVMFPKYEWPSHPKSTKPVTVNDLRSELTQFTEVGMKAATLIRDVQLSRLHPELRALQETLQRPSPQDPPSQE